MPITIRLTLAFAGAVAVLVAIGGWLFVTVLSSSMLGSIDSQLATAAGVAGHYATPVSGGSSPKGTLPGEYLMQIVSPAGRVTASGPDAGVVPLVTGAVRRLAVTRRVTYTGTVDDESTRIVAEPYRASPGYVAVAAVSLDTFNATVGTIKKGVISGGVAVLVIAAAGSYFLARRALAPVERMRREVAALSRRDDGTGIPVPSTRDELATLARTMNDLLLRLHGSLERQRKFVADASHELRTPLAVLGAELELASRPGRTREQLSEAVLSAAEETARLTRLTEDLLLLARSDSDRVELRLARVEVRSVLERSARAAEHRAHGAGLRIVVSASTNLQAIIDADRVREALDNLLDNAIRFAPPGTSIEVRAEARDHVLTIEVLDRGPGFPEEYLPHAFERFRRPTADRSRSEGGTGLGLAIVDVIARAHGGLARAANREGGGAAVRLEIPASGPRATSGATTKEVSGGSPRTSRSPLSLSTAVPKTGTL